MARDEDFRVQLEGGAETLEVAAVRYRALNVMLDSLSWREKLSDNQDLLQALVASHAEVVAAQASAHRLLQTRGAAQLAKLLKRVDELLARAEGLIEKRLSTQPSLLQGLQALQAEVAPTPSGDGKVWRAARLKLPLSDALISELPAHTARLHELAVRPPRPQGRGLPWSPQETKALLADLTVVDGRCAKLWRRLDAAGERLLLAWVGAPGVATLTDDGPARLISAESERRRAHGRISDVLSALFVPLTTTQHEHAALLLWLVEGQGAPQVLPVTRANLLALAARLAAGPPSNEAQWAELEGFARNVDERSDDARALLDNLNLFLRIKSPPPGKREPEAQTLLESLLRLRALR